MGKEESSTLRLDPRPVRLDLTSRECARILGGVIGCLATMASEAAVRDAVRWWAGADEAWESFVGVRLEPIPRHLFERLFDDSDTARLEREKKSKPAEPGG